MSFVGKNSIKMEKQEFDRMEAEELIKAAMEAKEPAVCPIFPFSGWSGTSNKKR